MWGMLRVVKFGETKTAPMTNDKIRSLNLNTCAPSLFKPVFSTASQGIAGFGGRPKLPNPSFGNPAIRIDLIRGFASQPRGWFAFVEK
jgi:hypothetical protein